MGLEKNKCKKKKSTYFLYHFIIHLFLILAVSVLHKENQLTSLICLCYVYVMLPLRKNAIHVV